MITPEDMAITQERGISTPLFLAYQKADRADAHTMALAQEHKPIRGMGGIHGDVIRVR